jgi:alkanesulfonate monooxygenase SsuD/methylene tetrahydromethanopterin reductase-like flavin-dependent oxidoreductase (luciferase family)
MYITAVRSRMLQLGGEIGDGVLLSAGCAPGYIRKCADDIAVGAKKSGRSAEHVDVAGFVTAAVSDSVKEAVDSNKQFLAYIFRNVHHAENIRLGGAKVDQEGLAAAVGQRDWQAAKKFISDEVVFAHSVAGKPSDCAKQLEAFTEGGLDLPIVLPNGTQEARKQVVRMAREIVG